MEKIKSIEIGGITPEAKCFLWLILVKGKGTIKIM
jgi:hypothetical protein